MRSDEDSSLRRKGGGGSLTYRMDIVVHTGSTRAEKSTFLASLSFASGKEHACLLLHITGVEREGKVLEEEATTVVQHSLLGSEGDSWTRLDGALKELNGLFKGLIVSKAVDDISAVVALLDADGTMHVSASGRGEAYLIRGGSASQVTEYSKGKPSPTFVHISSGQIEPGDAVVFATQRLLRALTPAGLTEASRRGEEFLEDVQKAMEAEGEESALITLTTGRGQTAKQEPVAEAPRGARAAAASRIRGRAPQGWSLPAVQKRLKQMVPVLQEKFSSTGEKAGPLLEKTMKGVGNLREKAEEFVSDLRHPERKRKAHLLLLAGVFAAFLIVWLTVSLFTSTQRSKTRSELAELIQTIESDITMAENRRIAGDSEAANAILQRAEEHAKQVLINESRLYRTEANNLLQQIRQKHEEINNVTRVPARVLVNLTSKNPTVDAQGLVGLNDGEFYVYDHQDVYRVILNRIDDPRAVSEEEVITQGVDFPRFKTQVYLTTGNTALEVSGNQVTAMKTDDPQGWILGKDVKTYLRYLYVLVPDKKQIYKYERLTNRYSAPVQYNVNGDLTGAISMAIDGPVYVLKEGGSVVKLFRGEAQPFAIRRAPDDVLKTATKIFKVQDRSFYFLDPENKRVIVIGDGGANGEASYYRQFILDGEDIGTLQDLYVDPEELHLYVLDNKRVYVIDLKRNEELPAPEEEETTTAPVTP